MTTLFCACSPGLEPLVAAEVRALGLPATEAPGGVEVHAGLDAAARLLLELRCATRVLVRLGQVRATSFAELVKRGAALPFERVVRRGQAVAWRVTCHKSKLYHSAGVAERLHTALEMKLGGPSPRVKPAAEDEDGTAQLFLARFDDDVCTVSADASGALLHRRGWRAAQSQAPLRETLAAALLEAGGFTGTEPLVDPFCGGGTIVIEAALRARRVAPGLQRSFALEGWPGQSTERWAALRAELRARAVPASAHLEGSDVDAHALDAARSNARAAGVEILWLRRAVAELRPPSGPPGLVASNPPYGKRVGLDPQRTWRELGVSLRTHFRGWRAVVLCPDPRLAAAAGLRWTRVLHTQNGGLRVEVLRAEL